MEQEQDKNGIKRPFGVSFLAILAGIAAFFAVINTLQMLHLFPIAGPYGIFRFFVFDFWGAVIWGIIAAIYIWLTRKLWNVEYEGWVFILVFSVLGLSFALISWIGGTSIQAMLPSIIVNGLIFIYAILPGTKEVFEVGKMEASQGQQGQQKEERGGQVQQK